MIYMRLVSFTFIFSFFSKALGSSCQEIKKNKNNRGSHFFKAIVVVFFLHFIDTLEIQLEIFSFWTTFFLST